MIVVVRHMAADVLGEVFNIRDDSHGRYEADLHAVEAERYAAADRSVPCGRVASNLCTLASFPFPDWILR